MKSIFPPLVWLIGLLCIIGACSQVPRTQLPQPSLAWVLDHQSSLLLRDWGVEQVAASEQRLASGVIRFRSVSIGVGYDGTRNLFVGNVADAISTRKEPYDLGFFYLFQQRDRFVLISNYMMPHIGDVASIQIGASTEGYYVLNIKTSPELLRKFAEQMKKMDSEQYFNLGRSFDGSRIDFVEVRSPAVSFERVYINPVRDQDFYQDDVIEATDNV